MSNKLVYIAFFLSLLGIFVFLALIVGSSFQGSPSLAADIFGKLMIASALSTLIFGIMSGIRATRSKNWVMIGVLGIVVIYFVYTGFIN